ncbi:MAG TPA: deaminase [Patescibacteria group bacterium]|nr:deaminase [Patescibacteria group bacterium]
MTDKDYLQLAIENSKKSMQEGNFPAGAVVVKDGKIIASEVSSPYPNLFHADSKAVTTAFEKVGPLQGATLYIGLECCLMCTGVAYWSGIEKVVYAVSKKEVSSTYYETSEDTTELVKKFNHFISFIHVPELAKEALEIVHEWEQKNGL